MNRRESSTIVVGEITGPHGLAGEVKFRSYLVGDLEITDGMVLTLLFPDGKKLTKQLLKVRGGHKGLLLTIEGISDRDSAESLKGVRVEVDADIFPDAPEGEYYWRDLIGLSVFLKAGEEIGKVVNLVDRAEQDLLVIDMGGREVMVPFVEPIVVSVDIEAGRLVINPPEGLLEIAGT